MGEIQSPKPVLPIVAAFSRDPAALDWARERCAANWGAISLESDRFPFVDTEYYESSMGSDLLKTFWAGAEQVDPGTLAASKVLTNAWEVEYALTHPAAVARPLNLDPGYLSESKLVLASTKDHAHRIYLGQGIYAEITLRYYKRAWREQDWTYPDYRRPEYHAFFDRCRHFLRDHAGPPRSAG